jgi:hypothetical protein
VKFWMLSNATTFGAIDANNSGHAAKLFAEKGACGVQTIVDEDGCQSKWRLDAVVVYYAYPVHEVGDG